MLATPPLFVERWAAAGDPAVIRPASAFVLLCLVAFGARAEDDAPACAPCTLRVMSFNIEWGGAHVRFESVVEAIVAARADLAGIQEPEGNLERLANALGWHYNRRNHVISRYPLVDPPGGDGRFLFVEVAPGQVVAIANVHLPSDPYGPHWLRQGHTEAELTALERDVRLTKIAPLIDTLAPIHARGVPVFLTGDFNSPSHEDWTEEAVGRVPHREVAFAWPVSRAVAAAGFADSWRQVHPDPVAHPGFTWWAARQRIEDYNPTDPADQERIDFVWFAGPAEVRSSEIVGEEGGQEVAISVSPWPSDHRAVISEFEVQAAPMPVLVTTGQHVHRAGDALPVYWNAPDGRASVVLLHDDGDGEVTERRLAQGSPYGRIELPTTDLEPGRYRVALIDADGRTLSRNDFRLLAPGAQPAVTVEGEAFAAGEAVPVSWDNAPGNRWDWIVVFDADAPVDAQDYRAYAYVNAESSGRLELGAHTLEGGEWPLPPGRYVVRLLEDDGFTLLAESAPFEIHPAADAPAGTR
jgi:endonuclease/exonuclease/phosphatase family metal-dependent hydrolase